MHVSVLENALSVASLTHYIQDLLEGDRLLRNVWVIGEVSSLHNHPKGLFFTLCDPEEGASINCVVWNNQRYKLQQQPQQGEQILLLGRVNLYVQRGEYKLTVVQVLSAGEGLQSLRYQQLRNRLQAEGLFDLERKRALHPHPQIIAVVTSPTAAAWGDIKRTLSQHYPGLHLLLSPAIVQGNDAPPSIVTAIERVNRDGRAQVLILARGGGAVEDLSCFNDERVVRAIANSQIPVITGIGHQRDESLADLVADVSAHTPTAAAEMAVPDYYQLLRQHQQLLNTLITVFKRRFDSESAHLKDLKERMKKLPITSRSLNQAEANCHLLRHKLAALNPQSVLDRGYAVVRQGKQAIVRSVDELTPEQELTIQLGKGIFKVKVIEILSK